MNPVEAFFSRGRLLTPEALRYLENKNIESFLADNYDLIVDIEDLMAREDKVRILKNITEKKTEVTTADIVKFYNSKYEKMKNIIVSRLQKDFVSINKLDDYSKDAFVIGIVRDKKDAQGRIEMDIEDSTGSITATLDAKEGSEIEPDDVIAIQGSCSGKTLIGKAVLYPDMPLRQPNTGSGRICFISGLYLNEAPAQDFESFLRWFEGQETRYLFVAGSVGDKGLFESMMEKYCSNKKVFVAADEEGGLPNLPVKFSLRSIISLSNPSMVEVNGIKILMMDNFRVRMLKMRHLGNIKPVLADDPMILDELPDIVHYDNPQAAITNYRSTTILQTGSLLTEFRPVIADLATRECRQLEAKDWNA